MFSCLYISDTVIERYRTFRINLVECASTFATALSAFVSGLILLQFGYIGGFVVSSCTCILNIIFLTWFVPDPRQNLSSQPTFLEEVGLSEDHVDLQDKSPFKNKDKHNREMRENVSEKITDSNQDSNNTNESLINENNVLLPLTSPKQQDMNKHTKHDKKILTMFVCSTEVNKIQSTIEYVQDCSHDNSKINMPSNNLTCLTKKTVKDILVEANPYTNFKRLHQILVEQKQSQAVIFLLIASFTSMLCWMGDYIIIVIYVKSRPLNFSETDVGYFLAVQSISLAVIGYLILNSIIQRCLKCCDTLVITISLAFHGVYFILLGLSTSKLMIYSIQLLIAIAALEIPGIRSTLTKRVDSNAHGTVLACCATLEALGTLVGTVGATVIYAKCLTFHRGASYFFMAIFPILSSLLIGSLYWKERTYNDLEKDDRINLPKCINIDNLTNLTL